MSQILTMEPVSCFIPICEYEFASVLINVGDRVQDFDEYVWQQYRMSWRTNSVINLG
jgi:hypothetical protein